MRFLLHLLSWLFLILEAVNRVAFVVAGVGMAWLGALGVYGTRAAWPEAEGYLMRISRGDPAPEAAVTKPRGG